MTLNNIIKRMALFIIIIPIALLVVSCDTDKACNGACSKLKKNDKGQTIVHLQQQWFANSGFAGEIVAKEETASNNNLQIEVIVGSDQIDTRQIVKMGEAEFGVAGAEQIMQANEKGENFVVIGVINYKSLASFISKRDKKILSPKDMVGKKIGTMEGSPVDLIYQVLKKKEHLEIDKKNEIPTGWTTTGFIQDEYDIYPAFINDEPVTFANMKPPIDLNIIEPSNYGVNFIGTVYFTKKELVDCCPEIVQSFVNAIAEGWDRTIKDPKNAILLLKSYDKNIDEDKESKSLLIGMSYYTGEEGKTLFAKEATWNEMAELLKNIGSLKSFDYNSTIENKFITWYYTKNKPQ
jgi:NitT/TauT family transport system substrate-binding protein